MTRLPLLAALCLSMSLQWLVPALHVALETLHGSGFSGPESCAECRGGDSASFEAPCTPEGPCDVPGHHHHSRHDPDCSICSLSAGIADAPQGEGRVILATPRLADRPCFLLVLRVSPARTHRARAPPSLT